MIKSGQINAMLRKVEEGFGGPSLVFDSSESHIASVTQKISSAVEAGPIARTTSVAVVNTESAPLTYYFVGLTYRASAPLLCQLGFIPCSIYAILDETRIKRAFPLCLWRKARFILRVIPLDPSWVGPLFIVPFLCLALSALGEESVPELRGLAKFESWQDEFARPTLFVGTVRIDWVSFAGVSLTELVALLIHASLAGVMTTKPAGLLWIKACQLLLFEAFGACFDVWGRLRLRGHARSVKRVGFARCDQHLTPLLYQFEAVYAL